MTETKGTREGGGNMGEKGEEKSIENAIKGQLKDLLEKRRESGDARPCGPHTLAPIYESIFWGG